MSIVDPISCDSLKFLATSFLQKDIHQKRGPQKSCILRDHYQRFLSQFQDYPETFDYTKFKLNFRNIVQNLQTLGKKYLPKKKRTILATFSLDN